ncbi:MULTISPECIES: RNA-binding domain-containing protein [Halobacterium]|uniref:UPF0201 protein VNG_2454C n=4 Tax=Halobacterium salinarum TaxID=2242 RepID=Q9HMN9_HALSA|nr:MULTISPECIES: RNA-binding domain-containing protein [Halobacterium]AAG20532.1 conserved hypothetical protein [Halobacterium salinarum NRC-1]MBB6089537.1 hypothetical protein [Halobacterium salinarum]MCF2164287.1 coaE operon protein [Halobacterium salinarum]MCF2167074.1 coaE operon protein [Halobacterium salinarum]MCF2207270.1 coaE operon protein [Halobacterium salinarum]
MTDTTDVTVRVTAPVYPTEPDDRVADAILRLFPDATVTVEDDRAVAETDTTASFREQLFDQRILDTAREQFQASQTDAGFSFDLKKQAAFNGTVNFAVGNPDELGDLHVEVTVAEPAVQQFIDHLAPPTDGGEPLEDP